MISLNTKLVTSHKWEEGTYIRGGIVWGWVILRFPNTLFKHYEARRIIPGVFPRKHKIKRFKDYLDAKKWILKKNMKNKPKIELPNQIIEQLNNLSLQDNSIFKNLISVEKPMISRRNIGILKENQSAKDYRNNELLVGISDNYWKELNNQIQKQQEIFYFNHACPNIQTTSANSWDDDNLCLKDIENILQDIHDHKIKMARLVQLLKIARKKPGFFIRLELLEPYEITRRIILREFPEISHSRHPIFFGSDCV